jgi:hypothetical protein
MPRCARLFLLSLAVALTACGSSQRIPHYEDVEGAKRVMMTLSPWEDGSPDRSNDGRIVGEEQSDRQVFARWFKRYYENEVLFQHDKNYQPFDVPSTPAKAVQQQRQYESEQQARQAAKDDRQRVEADARREERLRQQALEATTQVETATDTQADTDEQAGGDVNSSATTTAQTPAKPDLDALRDTDAKCRDQRTQEEKRLIDSGLSAQSARGRVLITMPCPGDEPLW